MPDYVVAHLTSTKTYRILCSECGLLNDGAAQDLPADFCNPFVFHGSCGHSFKVLLNFRGAYRKLCKLPGEYTLVLDNRRITGFCSVLDLSKTGMQLEANYLPRVHRRQAIHIITIFDDSSRTRLPLSGVVQWRKVFKRRAVIGIEFAPLNPYQQQVLGFYLM